MRIAVGGLFHESNSFSTERTTLEDFRRWSLTRGDELIGHWRDADSEIAGMVDVARDEGVELVPTTMAWAAPSGPIEDGALEWVIRSVAEGLRLAGRLDGVLLSLHGASVAVGEPDPEARLLAAARDVVGAKTPVIATTDYHANLTAEMVGHLTAVVGYDTYPHVDFRARGREATELMVRTVEGQIRPTVAHVHPPLVCIPQVQETARRPMVEVMEAAHEVEAFDGVLNVTIAGGFAYSDIPRPGVSVAVTTDGDRDLAGCHAYRLAERIWQRREGLQGRWPDVRQAVRQALEARWHPAILVDIGDNIGGGTPGDGTALLSELLAQGARGAVVMLHDPEGVGGCVSAGLGAELELAVGGKSDSVYGPPCRVRGRVERITDGRFESGTVLHKGFGETMGTTVRLAVSDNAIVLTERRTVPWSLGQLRSLGIEPASCRIIVVKAAIAYKVAFGGVTGEIIESATPGWTTPALATLRYRRLERPVWPLDADVVWPQ